MAIPHIIIAGGGTAGWMAANLIQQSWPQTRVTLIESKTIGTIGVGEGSTPYLKHFFKQLGITDEQWMPACNATYKTGIQFSSWTNKPGYSSYFHPFFSQLDIKPGDPFFYNANMQRMGYQANAHPDKYFVNTQLAAQCLAPIPNREIGFELDYGYHFDAGLLGTFLKQRAIQLGVEHIEGDIENVEVSESGNISHLVTKAGAKLSADFFIDCTGFQSLLLQKTLNVPFTSFKDNLINDAAVAIQTPNASDFAISPKTVSTAFKHGWAWNIPLTNRTGNGYVYSTEHCSPDEAEHELRQALGIGANKDIKARHLKMRVGRVSQHWHRNCLAIGLSQGFIEPLEATALMLVQYSIQQFIDRYQDLKTPEAQKRTLYNQEINRMFDGIRDYIVTHYCMNSRTDTAYWQHCREESILSDNLTELLEAWTSKDKDFDSVLEKQQSSLVYLRPSWYIILAGMGCFPETLSEPPTSIRIPDANLSLRLCQKYASELFNDHRSVLASRL
ncbi:tryptophan 7-halogenase [Alteromonadaceae bacterium M269]|nr:tryptophan 7-halogenase [Alteromonadaceae bacterium M269]